MRLLIHVGIKVNPCKQKGPQEAHQENDLSQETDKDDKEQSHVTELES